MEIKYTFRNNGLETYNDDVFSQVFDLPGNEFFFSIKPDVKTKFWRFGIVLSKVKEFSFRPNEGRYADPNLKFIEIFVGDQTLEGNWYLPNRIGIGAYHIEGFEGHPKIKETYKEFSPVEIMLKSDSDQKIYFSYSSLDAIDSQSFPKNGYNYFRIFSWSDKTEFAIDCTITVIDKFVNRIKNSWEPDCYWLLKLPRGWDKNLIVGKIEQFDAYISFEGESGIQQIAGPDFDRFKKLGLAIMV